MGERDVKWENNQAIWRSWKPKAQGNRGYQACTAEKMVTDSQNRERTQKMPTFLCTKHGA